MYSPSKLLLIVAPANAPTSEKSATATTAATSLWELPEVLIYHIAGFVAPPTHRAHVLCHQIAPLCKSARMVVLDSERSAALWDAVLIGCYGIDKSKGFIVGGRSSTVRRSCKRLRRSPCQSVRDAHKLLKDNTEIAFFYLSEMAHMNTTGKKGNSKQALSRAKLCALLSEYGPHLRINHRVSSGGTYLVEVCRARNVTERIILRCVEELVEQRGALLDLPTVEAQNSKLTALCVAAVRGMPLVVQYLLRQGASSSEQCSGRFRLSTNPRKSVRCTNATPLDFATTMRQAEFDEGATKANLANLDKCIQLLVST